MVLFEHNNTIYIKDNMIYYLAKPFQYEDNDVRVNLRQESYDINKNKSPSITLPDVNSIPGQYNVFITYIAIRKPVNYEV